MDRSDRRSVEAAARACVFRFGRTRLALSRLFEGMLKPFLGLLGRQEENLGAEPKRILVVEYWHLGDLVLLTPFLRNLRRQYPKAHIAYLAHPKVAPLLEGQGLVDDFIPVVAPWAPHMSRWKKYVSRHHVEFFRCIWKLRARQFDWGFTARADIRDSFVLWAGGVKRRIGYGFAYGGSLLTDVVPPDLERPHFSDRWLHLLEVVGKPVPDRHPELHVEAEDRQWAREFLLARGIQETDLLIAVHPEARNPLRQWGAENFFEVVRGVVSRFEVKVLWFRDPGAQEVTEFSAPWLVPVALPLRQFLAVLSECRLLLCNDTGPMHLATAVGVPVVAVFGPTMPAWFGPRDERSRIVLHEGVWCRPCADRCLFEQPYCLRSISVKRVLSVAQAAVAKMVFGSSEEFEGDHPVDQGIQGSISWRKER